MTITETRLSKIVSIASWLIPVALAFSIVSVWLNPLVGGPVALAIGTLGAQLFYTALYGIEAILLTFAKLTGRMRLRKAALLTIFLTGSFTLAVSISLVGFSVNMLDNMALFGLAGLCYLYWKIKTEYVTRDKFLEMQERDSQQAQ